MSGGCICEKCERKSPVGCLGVMRFWSGTGHLSRVELLFVLVRFGRGKLPRPKWRLQESLK